MTEFKKLLLSRVHELIQIHVDRITWFILASSDNTLSSKEKEGLFKSLCAVTASLGQHTKAVFSVNPNDLDEHLENLFDRLEDLDAQCINCGGPILSAVLSEYRSKFFRSECMLPVGTLGADDMNCSLSLAGSAAG